MTVPLPPPVIFTHKEVLHAIELPSLATFLTSLHVPEHLLKLNDILLRYRTPKSYHRLDVREISSSELPVSSPEPESEAPLSTTERQSPGGKKRKRGELEEKIKGEPVELDEGVTLEDYRADRDSRLTAVDNAVNQGDRQDQDDIKDGIKEAAPSIPRPAESALDQPVHPVPTGPMSITTPAPVPRSITPDSITAVRPSPRPTSPEATHHLPPSGPKRRIRELRLDLRTLDAAALFALETWRREVLGLEKMEMNHPDSIWYKDATPTPTPEPEPQSRANGVKKRGRPRKSQSGSKSRTPQIEHSVRDGEEGEIDDLASIEPEDVETLEVPGNGNGDVIGEQDKEEIQDVEAFDAMVDAPVAHTTDANADTIPNIDGSASNTQKQAALSQVEESLDPALGDLRSPSPDILLVDGFNLDEEHDPDFAPEPSPEPIKRRGRPRQSTNAVAGPSLPSPVRTGRSHPAFTAAPPPAPMQLGRKSLSRSHHISVEDSGGDLDQELETMDDILPEASGTKSKSPTKRISISPTRAPVTPNREKGHLGLFLSMSRSPSRPSLSPVRDPDNLDSFLSIAAPILTEGQSSDSAILIPDSPEKQPRQSAFVPLVREPMKVQAPRNPPVDRGQSARYDAYPESGRKGKSKAALVESIEVDYRRPHPMSKAKGRRSENGLRFTADEVYETIEINEEVEEVYEYEKKRKSRTGEDEDDEWDSFRF